MRHGMSGRKLGRTKAHRKALFENMATSLLKHGQIRTTLPKAKDLRKVVEPLITLAKKGDLHSRRLAGAKVKEQAVLKHLFDNIGPANKDRAGGYTRIIKAGFRLGDAAPMAIIELTDKPSTAFAEESTETTKKASTKKTSTAKKAASSETTEKKASTKTAEKKTETKKAAPKKASTSKTATKSASSKATAEKKPAAKKTTAKKTTAKKDAK